MDNINLIIYPSSNIADAIVRLWDFFNELKSNVIILLSAKLFPKLMEELLSKGIFNFYNHTECYFSCEDTYPEDTGELKNAAEAGWLSECRDTSMQATLHLCYKNSNI